MSCICSSQCYRRCCTLLKLSFENCIWVPKLLWHLQSLYSKVNISRACYNMVIKNDQRLWCSFWEVFVLSSGDVWKVGRTICGIFIYTLVLLFVFLEFHILHRLLKLSSLWPGSTNGGISKMFSWQIITAWAQVQKAGE